MISALTAEGRVQCSILLVLPFVMMALLFVINRAYILELLNYPMIFVVMFGFMGVGALWMHKIINFDF